MEEAGERQGIRVEFPGLSPAEAGMMARALELEFLSAGAPATEVKVARDSAEAMDFGATILLGAGLLTWEFLKSGAKSAGAEVGKEAGRDLYALVRRRIDDFCRRRQIAAAVAVPAIGTTWMLCSEFDRSDANSSSALPGNLGTLGVVILGASVFPHLDGLDNPAFARSAASVMTMFSRPPPPFRDVAVLDLFDSDSQPFEIAEAIERHIDADPNMADLLIFYCGHGSFLRDRTHFLTLKGTRLGREAFTGLKLKDLRHDLEARLANRRLYLVLDCCFAGAAVKDFMGPNVDRVVAEAVQDALPPGGWVVLAASSGSMPAMAPAGQELTMFTGAFTHVIETAQRPLSFDDIAAEARRYIQGRYGAGGVLPECHAPLQSGGDLRRTALFGGLAGPAAVAAPSIEAETPGPAPAPQRRPDQLAAMAVAEGYRIVHATGHNRAVFCLAMSPDGTLLASGAQDDSVRLWDVRSGRELRTLYGHDGYVDAVAFSGSGRLLASGAKDNLIKIWDTATGRMVRTLRGHTGAIQALQFSPDAKVLVSTSADGTFRFWDLVSYREIDRPDTAIGSCRDLAFSSDGAALILVGGNGIATVRDVASGAELRRIQLVDGVGHPSVLSADGRLLATADPAIRLLAVATGRQIGRLAGHDHELTVLAFSRDAGSLASGGHYGEIKLWDLQDGREIRHLPGHGSQVRSTAFGKDGTVLYAGYWNSVISAWDLGTGEMLRNMGRSNGGIMGIACSPDGRTLVGGGEGLRVWDFGSDVRTRNLGEDLGDIFAVALSANGRHLASGGQDEMVRLWDLSTGLEVRTMAGHSAAIIAATFTPDGRLLATGANDGTAIVWDVASGRRLATLVGHELGVSSVAASPDSRTLVTGSHDGGVRIWDLPSGAERGSIVASDEEINAVAISPDGRIVATGAEEGRLTRWDLATGAELSTLSGHADGITAIAFGADGRTIASGSNDKTVRLWDLGSGTEIWTGIGHQGTVYSVAFSNDFDLVVSGSIDGSICRWKAASGELVDRIVNLGSDGSLIVDPMGLPKHVLGDEDRLYHFVLNNQVVTPSELRAREQDRPKPVATR